MATSNSIKRHPNFKDLTGRTFGQLTVLREAGRTPRGQITWACKCECGNSHIAQGTHLRSGHTTSCGCFRQEASIAANTTHGLSGSPEFFVWYDMIRRCYDTARPHYVRYGRRGISVCSRWRDSFATFYDDMGPRPSSAHSIDRIDNEGDYEPDNCRWATLHEQSRNTRRNHNLTHNGITMCITDWANRVGVDRRTITKRLNRGWSVELALTTPVKHATSPPHPE